MENGKDLTPSCSVSQHTSQSANRCRSHLLRFIPCTALRPRPRNTPRVALSALQDWVLFHRLKDERVLQSFAAEGHTTSLQSIGLHGQTSSQQSHCHHRAGPGRPTCFQPPTGCVGRPPAQGSAHSPCWVRSVDFTEPPESSKETQSTTWCFPPLASHTGSHLSVPKEISRNKNPTLINEYMSLRSKWDSSIQIHEVQTLICQSKLSALRSWEQLIAEGTLQSSKIPYKGYQNLLLHISLNDKRDGWQMAVLEKS